jgi:hypothetical protein
MAADRNAARRAETEPGLQAGSSLASGAADYQGPLLNRHSPCVATQGECQFCWVSQRFFAAVRLRAGDFFAALLAVDLRAGDFLAAVRLRAGDFLAAFFAVDLRAVDFLAGDFLAAFRAVFLAVPVVFLTALRTAFLAVFFAEVFLALVFLAGDFLAVAFFVAATRASRFI